LDEKNLTTISRSSVSFRLRTHSQERKYIGFLFFGKQFFRFQTGCRPAFPLQALLAHAFRVNQVWFTGVCVSIGRLFFGNPIISIFIFMVFAGAGHHED